MLAFVVCATEKKTKEEIPRNIFVIKFLISLSKKKFSASFDDIYAKLWLSLKKRFPKNCFLSVNVRRKQMRR